MGRVTIIVIGVCEQSIFPWLRYSYGRGCRRNVGQETIKARDGLFEIAANLGRVAFRFDFPGISQRITLVVEYIESGVVGLAGRQDDTLLRTFAVEAQRIDARRTVGRSYPGPKVVHDVHDLSRLSSLREHAEPGRRTFLFLAPEEDI